MYTAMLSVENLLGAEHDVWSVNVEEDYHEEKGPTGGEDPGGADDNGDPGNGEGTGKGRGTANGRSGRPERSSEGAGRGTGRDAPILPSRARSL
jgi:hypothetical protein